MARESEISASQLFGCRRQALSKGLITDRRLEASGTQALTFTPVEVAKDPSPPRSEDKVALARPRGPTRTLGVIEIELKGGDRMRVEGCADAGLIVRIISTLRRA